MDLDSSSRTDLQETTIRDLYEEYAAAEEAGDSVQKAREIESYLHDAFETVREELADYDIELTATPDIRYDPDHEGATYSPQRDHTGPLDVGHPKQDSIKDHTLLNALAEEAVHAYHNQLAEEYFDDLELGEPMSDIYNDNCTLTVGYDEALTAPIVHDIAATDEALEDHMERLGDHYSAADETVGERFEEMTAFIMERLDGRDGTGPIKDALSFRDEMLRAGETPF
jgi:hypothetical protein